VDSGPGQPAEAAGSWTDPVSLLSDRSQPDTQAVRGLPADLRSGGLPADAHEAAQVIADRTGWPVEVQDWSDTFADTVRTCDRMREVRDADQVLVVISKEYPGWPDPQIGGLHRGQAYVAALDTTQLMEIHLTDPQERHEVTPLIPQVFRAHMEPTVVVIGPPEPIVR